MARNKYPEVTVEKILDVAQRLFLTKGYDNTTIQDIVDELGGLTKGAIYHHFKSKEDIMDALGDKIFWESNPFTELAARKDLNGLQKLQEITKFSLVDPDRAELNRQSIPILKNPRILAQMIETDRTVISPLITKLIEEGNQDGSIHTKYAKEAADVVLLLSGLWLAPSIYPGTGEELQKRLDFIKDIMDGIGIPIFDEGIMAYCRDFLKKIAPDNSVV